jgi:hypothetical protein
VVDVAVDTTGSDRGQTRPTLGRLNRRYGRMPRRHLVDGGFHKNADTEWVAGEGVLIYGPATNSKHKTDPLSAPAQGRAKRCRLASAHEEPTRQSRLQETGNRRMHQRPLPPVGAQTVHRRGVAKVKPALLWFAVANNILVGHRLQTATP